MEIILIFLASVVFGYCVGYIVRGLKNDALYRRNKYLEREYLRHIGEISALNRRCRRDRESLLNLQRRYDKIYSNDYKKK